MPTARSVLKAFGARLRQLRSARNWTQEELARRARRHWTYIGGLERGERNPTLVVLLELAAALNVSPSELLTERHAVCATLGATESDVLEAISRGFRALIDVKGKLAELYMNRRLSALQCAGVVDEVVWHDEDGRPDFAVRYRGRDLAVECKNVRNEAFRQPPAFKVELQRTRNSKDGTPTRAYRVSEFDVLGVALFNQTGRWDYLFIATHRLERRPTMPEFLAIMQRVPMAPEGAWTDDPVQAFEEAVRRGA